MRKIVVIAQVSLDGVIQGPGGPGEDTSNGFTAGGWAMPYFDDAGAGVINEVIGREFDLLLGRRTYDIWVNYWPDQVDDPIGKAFNKATKYVVTHRPDQLAWEHSTGISGDVVAELQQLKATDGPALHVWGSSHMLQTLIAADLVDEYFLWVFPVVLGGGKRLFEDGVPPRGLTLVSTERSASGVLFNTYRPAGAIPAAR